MKYKYRPFITTHDPDGIQIYPLVNVVLRNGDVEESIDCLVDSGASESLFSLDIAVLLGIDLSNAPRQEYTGIGSDSVHGFRAEIQLKLDGFPNWVTFEAGFADLNEMPLLGHSGFFELYKIAFHANEAIFEIKNV